MAELQVMKISADECVKVTALDESRFYILLIGLFSNQHQVIRETFYFC